MTGDPAETKKVPEKDFFLKEDVFAYVSRAEYDWLRYPRSGPSSIGWVLIGCALTILLPYLGSWVSWRASANRDNSAAPVLGQTEFWAIVAAVILAVMFFAAG